MEGTAFYSRCTISENSENNVFLFLTHLVWFFDYIRLFLTMENVKSIHVCSLEECSHQKTPKKPTSPCTLAISWYLELDLKQLRTSSISQTPRTNSYLFIIQALISERLRALWARICHGVPVSYCAIFMKDDSGIHRIPWKFIALPFTPEDL